MTPGARITDSGVAFRVWAPRQPTIGVVDEIRDRTFELPHTDDGWFVGTVPDMGSGDRYSLRIDDGATRPDPASLSQPDGVHGPSEVVDLTFDWTDGTWSGIELRTQIIYEMHVGTFTPEGTFAAAIDRLDHLVDVGFTTIELMPVAQCPGARNWGYDGVALYATQNSYGGARGLQAFVDACHTRSLAVWLDVVYNHLGPEGNYLADFAPFFTDNHNTPWGPAVNLDDHGSQHVRTFFIENALMWLTDFHIDGLRIDAIHALRDDSPTPFLLELADACHARGNELGRRIHVVGENERPEPHVVRDTSDGGWGLDAAWNDDFHHALHVALTGETARYYAHFERPIPDLAKALASGYVRTDSPAQSAADLPRTSLIVFAQNHDQIGNRGHGDRLSTLVDPPALRLAAGLVLLSPWVPMLFMGEEWGETRPFLYFVDHGDAGLLEAVRAGRRSEFQGLVDGEVPDPAAPRTRDRSVLDWTARTRSGHEELLTLHRALIAARNEYDALTDPRPDTHRVECVDTIIVLHGTGGHPATLAMFNVGDASSIVSLPPGRWRRVLDGAEPRFGGAGAVLPDAIEGRSLTLDPWAFALYLQEETT